MNLKTLKPDFEKLNYYALLLFAFSLDFHHTNVKYSLAIWVITGLFCLDFRQKISLKKRFFIPMFLLIALVIVRISMATLHGNFQALFIKLVDTQLMMIVLPFLMFYIKNRYFNLKQVLRTYILGCFTSCIVVVIYFYLYRFNILHETTAERIFPVIQPAHSFVNDIGLFQNFVTPYFKHRAGMGLNLSLSIACIIYFVKQSDKIILKNKIALAFAVLFISTTLYATGSRSGLISLIIVSILGVIYLFSGRKVILTISFFSILALFIGISSLKTTRPLVINNISCNSYEKIRESDPRFTIWECCVELIKENPLVGVGYSNVKPSLWEKFKEKGMTLNLRNKYNSHNQFFQFSLESGVLAGILYVLILLPIYFKRNTIFISICFSASLIVFSFFEDAFIIINGVSVFVFFMAILIMTQKRAIRTSLRLH